MNPSRPLPHINAAKCTGCGRCVGACGPHILILEVENWIKTARFADAIRCTGCSKCSEVCPFGAISMIADGKPPGVRHRTDFTKPLQHSEGQGIDGLANSCRVQ